MPQMEAELAGLDIDIVIDHFARIATADGLDAPPYRALLRLLQRDNVWAKLMGPYFISDAFPHYPDIAPFARGMITTAPNRIVWGSDWPHPSARDKMPDDGDLADLINEWAPAAAQRQKILVDNPRRLYRFD
jgi:2-pyrone-4,6-dicarboxylate lactonase